MLKLRNILLHNTIFIFIFLLACFYTFINILFEREYTSDDLSLPITAPITAYSIDGNKLVLILSKYKVKGTYYIKTKEEKEYLKNNLKIGDIYKITGEIYLPQPPTTKGLFNYKNYLKTKRINYLINITSIIRIKKINNLFYNIKNKIIKRLNNNPYLYTFIIGDKSYLKEDVVTSYQENGISHLFAISGMHITLLSSIFLKILKKLNVSENKRYLITSIILFFYLLIVGFSPSIVRGVLFFYLFTLNNLFYFYIKEINIYLLTLSIALFINPFYIYDIGFLYSYTISLALLLSNNYLSNNNYLLSLLKTSYISFISSLPISLYNYCSINILSIIYNLLFVPLISLIIFPMTLLVLILPFLVKPYTILTSLLEHLSLYLKNINFLKYNFKKLNIIIYIFLYIFIFMIINYQNKNKRTKYSIIIFILIILYIIPSFISSSYIKMIDVGQGDSFLLYSNNEAALIDTGGKTSYNYFSWQKTNKNSSIAKNITIPLLKQLGINKIKYLILTHGDYDHLGETLNILNNFRVETVIINCNKINYLENKIIKKQGNTIIGKEGLTLQVGDINLIQLNENLINENDSSQIYLATYNNKSMLFMGDASIKSESILLNKYNIEHIDILKVGHHGSSTSTSTKLLKALKPKIALISVGMNNKFGHPKKEIIKRLKSFNIKYYRTDYSGTVTINLNKNKINKDSPLNVHATNK